MNRSLSSQERIDATVEEAGHVFGCKDHSALATLILIRWVRIQYFCDVRFVM